MILQIMQMSETELKNSLITADFRGMEFKEAALNRLLELSYDDRRRSEII